MYAVSSYKSFKAFVHAHDDLPAFHAAYLVGTLFAAAVLNLGIFACLITIHMCFDVYKFRDIHGFTWPKTLKAVFLESLTDVTLFSIALASSIYLHHSFALGMVGGIVRSELTIAALFAILIPKMEILDHSLAMFFHLNRYLHDKHFHLRPKLTIVQKACIGLTAIAMVLLILTPFFFAHSKQDLIFLLQNELLPWRL